jgi:multiple antibiotic resistance protein
VKGQKALIQMKGSLDELASDIALPFMVGAGTIPLIILMGHELSTIQAISALILVLILNFGIITLMKMGRDSLKKPELIIAYDKNMEILLRLNGFFLGAIGIDMIITGINHLYLN